MESKDVSAGLGSLPVDSVNQENLVNQDSTQNQAAAQEIREGVEEVNNDVDVAADTDDAMEPPVDLEAEQEFREDAAEEVHDLEADAAEEVHELAAAQEGSEDASEEVRKDVDNEVVANNASVTESSLSSVAKRFPTCLRKHLDNMWGGVQTVYRDHHRLHPTEIKKQIRSLTQEIQKASSKQKEKLKSHLQDKVWMLQNHKETARQEWMLCNPWSVYSLKRTNGEWKAEI